MPALFAAFASGTLTFRLLYNCSNRSEILQVSSVAICATTHWTWPILVWQCYLCPHLALRSFEIITYCNPSEKIPSNSSLAFLANTEMPLCVRISRLHCLKGGSLARLTRGKGRKWHNATQHVSKLWQGFIRLIIFSTSTTQKENEKCTRLHASLILATINILYMYIIHTSSQLCVYCLFVAFNVFFFCLHTNNKRKFLYSPPSLPRPAARSHKPLLAFSFTN